jgi:hypothetical protein
MRRHITAAESNGSHQIAKKQNLTSPARNPSQRNRGAIPGIPKKLTYGLGAIGLCFLFGVHIFLFKVLLSNERRLLDEFGSSRQSDAERRPTRSLSPLREIDYEFYTIRINSWKRAELLETSVLHHSSCPGVAAIQVIWCTDQGEPPSSLYDNPKVTVELHPVNSLNERFNIMEEPPTVGILSMDDDVLRPCEAIDAGFFKWTQNPGRMVGFDARSHAIAKDGTWSYGYLSHTERSNQYSMTLPRYSFLHRDYLRWYMEDMPTPIIDTIAKNFNCEDIAMSFFVTSHTAGKPPLLADFWASRSQIKLYSNGGISDSTEHKEIRDSCVEMFAKMLKVKDKLKLATYIHRGNYFRLGAEGKHDDKIHNERQQRIQSLVSSWKAMPRDKFRMAVSDLRRQAALHAFLQGLIEDTEPWEKRWGTKTKILFDSTDIL